MQIINYFECDTKNELIEKIEACDWGAAKFLAELLRENRFFEMLGGEGDLYLLMDGEILVSFLTLTKQDVVRDEGMYPWIGFVYTAPEYRGNRYSEKLMKYADIVTPNLTEACLLSDTPYKESYSGKDVQKIAEKIRAMGPKKIVITGIQRGKYIENHCFEGDLSYIVKTEKVGVIRSGTGDIFTAIVAADAVKGKPLKDSVKKASLFIKKCILKAIELDIPRTDGVPFEEVLSTLK